MALYLIIMTELKSKTSNLLSRSDIMKLPKELRKRNPNSLSAYGKKDIRKYFSIRGNKRVKTDDSVKNYARDIGWDGNHLQSAYNYLGDRVGEILDYRREEFMRVEAERVASLPVYKKYVIDPFEAKQLNDERFLKKLFKKFKLRGTQRFILKQDDLVVKDITVVIPTGSYNSMFIANPDISNFVEKWRYNSQVYYWRYLYWGDDAKSPNAEPNEDEVVMYISKDELITEEAINQTFNNGGYCLIGEVRDWFQHQYDKSKGNAKDKYLTGLNKFKDTTGYRGKETVGYMTKFKDGIPDNDLEAFANSLQVRIVVEKPFQLTPYIDFRPVKRARHTFKYTNTDIDHVELNPDNTSKYFNSLYTNDTKDAIIIEDVTGMNELVESLIKSGTKFIGNRTPDGYTRVKTFDAVYQVDEAFNKAMTAFEEDTGINSINSSSCYDALKHPKLNAFIKRGTHFNGTTDFIPVIGEMSVETFRHNGIGQHYDMEQAYARFKESSYYTGFMKRPTEFRQVNNFKRKGLYLIDDINFSSADQKFRAYNNKMRWYMNGNIYTDAELHMLTDKGVKFNVLAGAMGERFDFDFDDDMLDGKQLISKKLDIKISYYAKCTGVWASQIYNKRFTMNGSEKYFKNIACNDTVIHYNRRDQTADISYPKKNVFTSIHLASQITAYQRLVVLEQLLKMDINKIVRVCVDGIYFYDHDCEMSKVFRPKNDEMTFENHPTTNYLSNIFTNEDDEDAVELEEGYEEEENDINYNCDVELPTALDREYYHTELHVGAGGTGKTTKNLLDEGMLDCLYVAPSHKLAGAMKRDMLEKFNKNISVTVLARLEHKAYKDGLLKYNANVLCDEASQYDEPLKQRLLKLDFDRIILVGDLGYQLPPIRGIEMNEIGVDNVVRYTAKDQKRFKCKKLKELTNALRTMIKARKPTYEGMECILKTAKQVDVKTLKTIYTPEDMILASQHNYKDAYTELFKDQEKYIVRENTRLCKNGEVVYEMIEGIKMELRHGYTIHSVQGETYEKKLFIDHRSHTSIRMLYTAVSRVKSIEQLYIV